MEIELSKILLLSAKLKIRVISLEEALPAIKRTKEAQERILNSNYFDYRELEKTIVYIPEEF